MRRYVRILAMGLIIALSFCALAAAETMELGEIGIRYTPADGETCVTRERQSDEALGVLGVSRETLLSSMESDDAHLLILLADGRQLTLCVEAPPEVIALANFADLDLNGKQQFLSLLARKDNYGQAAWRDDVPGFALFSDTLVDTDAPMTYKAIALSTLYLGRVLTLRMDVIGREPTEDDVSLLVESARRILLLGASTETAAATEPAQLALPEQRALTNDTIVWTVGRDDLPLTINETPAVVGSTKLSLSGTTQPNTNVRYILNGTPSSRFKSDENGAFSTTVKDLTEGVNELEIIAFSDKQQSSCVGSVTLDWQLTPLALAQTEFAVSGGSVPISGLTLPGAKVSLIRKTSTNSISVDETGAFSADVKVKSDGSSSFTIRALADGYKRNDVVVSVSKLVSDDELLASLRKKAKTIRYTKLTQSPDAYKSKVVELTGALSELAYNGGKPSAKLTTADGDGYIVLCDNLLAIYDGDMTTLLGTLTGETIGGLPSLELALLVK